MRLFFLICTSSVRPTREHRHTKYKPALQHVLRHSTFLRYNRAIIIILCNSLPPNVDFSSLDSFRQSLNVVDFSTYLKCTWAALP